MKKSNDKSLKIIFIALLILATSIQSHAQNSQNNFFELTNLFLNKHVDERGYVAYENIKAQPESLNKLYKMIESYPLANKPANELKAFYTNVYNLLVIKQVVDLYPIYGPLEVDGFFDKMEHNVAGEMLTLNQVEKDKNLYVTKDERLHFAVVCGAKGCPPLANFAFTPEKIEAQLNERTRFALNDENFIRTEGKKVGISQIFNWYSDDFKKDGIVGYLNKYREKQIQSKVKTVYYKYNWQLNKQ